jgi:hypothetical protein
MRVLYGDIEVAREDFNKYKRVGFNNAGDLIVELKTAEDFQQEYENAIVDLIRKRYSLNQELAILRQRDSKPTEFSNYNAYVEQCKQEVKNNIK